MRIVHVITCLEPGGAEKQLLLLVAEQTKRYENVTVLYLKGNGTLVRQFESYGVQTHKVFALSSLLHSRTLLRYFSSSEVVHAHLPRSEIFVALLSLLKRMKFVVSKHNAERFIPNGHIRLSKWLALFVEKRVHKVICITNSVYKFLESVSEVRDKHKYTVIHYGIKKDVHDLETNKLRRKREVHRVRTVVGSNISIVCIARLVEQKNLHFLLDVLKILPDKFILTILGEGHLRKSLEQKIESLDLSKRVVLKGFVSNIEDYLWASDVMVLPSLYEGFGMVLLEAVTCDIPIVASDISVAREVMGENYPFLAPPTHKQKFALAIRESILWPRRDRGDAYKLILKKFSIETSFRNIDTLYRDLEASD